MKSKHVPDEVRFDVRVRDESGNISVEKLTKDQICDGLIGREMNLEDIGLALLNDLRANKGLLSVVVVEEKRLH